MHLSIRRYTSSDPAEITRKVKKGFLPLIAKAPGFVAYYAIRSGPDGWTSVSVFKTKAGAEKSDKVAAALAEENVAGELNRVPGILAGDVVAHVTLTK